MSSEDVLIVFAKEPRPGFVKTRMSPPLSAEQAAGLYAALLDDVLAATAEHAEAFGLAPVLAVHPPEACAALARRAPPGFRVVAQRGGSIPQSEIDASNAAIRGYNHDDETRGAILSAAGVADDGSILDAVNLNNLDDWTELHASLTS